MRKWISLLYISSERCEQHGEGLQSMGWTPLPFQSRTSSSEFLRCASSPPQGILRGNEEGHRRNSLEELPGWKWSRANPLTKDMHHAVHNLSLELYNKRYLLAHAALGRSLYCSLPLNKLNITFLPLHSLYT